MSAREVEDRSANLFREWRDRLVSLVVIAGCLSITALCILYLAYVSTGGLFGYQLAMTHGSSMQPSFQQET
jgi:hypothetical protein